MSHHIHSQASFSYTKSIWSILTVHNETGKYRLESRFPSFRSELIHSHNPANIWSHLLGAFWFIASLLYHVNVSSSQGFRLQDVLVIALYQLCVSVCFILSTFYHTFSDHSPRFHKFGNELDHLGIVLVMWGTGVSGTYFAFYCHQALRNVYFAFLTLTGLGCSLFTLRPKFRRPEYRTTRFLMYCFLGASLFAPVVHGLLRFGSDLQPMMGLTSFLSLALINFSGAAVYAARIPERWYPMTFDLLGQSHNWMHVLVLTGALARLKGLRDTVGVWQTSTGKYGFCDNII